MGKQKHCAIERLWTYAMRQSSAVLSVFWVEGNTALDRGHRLSGAELRLIRFTRMKAARRSEQKKSRNYGYGRRPTYRTAVAHLNTQVQGLHASVICAPTKPTNDTRGRLLTTALERIKTNLARVVLCHSNALKLSVWYDDAMVSNLGTQISEYEFTP